MLPATVHWLFDCHLVSLTDDYDLVVSHKVPAGLPGLSVRQLDCICLPTDHCLWPNPAYVRRHRETFAA